jgi:hypothetical protein
MIRNKREIQNICLDQCVQGADTHYPTDMPELCIYASIIYLSNSWKLGDSHWGRSQPIVWETMTSICSSSNVVH